MIEPIEASSPKHQHLIMKNLTHFDAQGQAHMVDVAEKPPTARMAMAQGSIRMQPETLALIRSGNAKKGDVLSVANIAAIQAAKKTSELIPLCHPLLLSRVAVSFGAQEEPPAMVCTATVQCQGQTGVEMEALTAVSVALLTIYDMLKAVDRGMIIEAVQLMHKEGGKSGVWQAEQQ